ncbi:MAG TPA: hypothetical protein DCG14_03035, partial [Phycisphaerales bacterium]|nr:hypothetical protein [Phycisphaerales bacterium]
RRHRAPEIVAVFLFRGTQDHAAMIPWAAADAGTNPVSHGERGSVRSPLTTSIAAATTPPGVDACFASPRRGSCPPCARRDAL